MNRFYLLLLLISPTCIFAQDSLRGFKDPATELRLEKDFDASLDPAHLDEWMKVLAAEPHHTGSEKDKKNAEFIRDQFQSWGYDTRIDTYYVLFPTPKTRQLELIAPEHYKAILTEQKVKGDLYTSQKGQLPSYNAYSIDGDVTGDLVFVNYGVPADYDKLEAAGIDVKGKIVIAKYYGSWRGIKPKLAAEKGAIGCIIYSDPADDGYVQGDTYPEGPFKDDRGVQRGSVMDMPLYPGDPLTPGYGATKDADRLSRAEAPTLTKIPVLPISYSDAKPLLAALEGPVAPSEWRGGLPITYHIGPGPARVHLKVEFNWDIKPANDVIAVMKGSEYPDEWVMRGNHHDAWVNGASDPVSGMVSLMEEARAVSQLKANGWTPKRTIVYCAWDAEEPGLLGSTEWVEDHAEELSKKAVAYVNTDGNSRGYLFAGGSHALEGLMEDVATHVMDPQKKVSVAERAKAATLVAGKEYKGYTISALGSGSDYSPFLQHLGIASLDIAFGGEGQGGEYHTNFDTYDHYTHFKDPGFAYGIALAEVTGHTILRLANADVLPFDYKRLYTTVQKYVDEVIELEDKQREKAQKINTNVENHYYDLAWDPEKPKFRPKQLKEVPYLNFAPLQNAMARMEKITKGGLADTIPSDPEKLNQMLFQAEKKLISEEGLPRRPWYRHRIYAPGFYTGYGVKTLPGIREAIEEEKYDEAQQQIDKLAESLGAFNDYLEMISKV